MPLRQDARTPFLDIGEGGAERSCGDHDRDGHSPPPAIMAYSMAVAPDIAIQKRLKDAGIQAYLARILSDLLPLLERGSAIRTR